MNMFDADYVLGAELPEAEPLVTNLIVPGITLLAAPPKYGKSWMMLQMALAVSSGGEFIDHETRRSGVLYLALEDGVTRLKKRLLQMGVKEAPGLYFSTEAPQTDDNLLDEISLKLALHSDIKLIIIDTLQKIKGETSGRNAYEADYAIMGELKRFADERNIAIVLVHHLRKLADETDPFNRISGSTGLTGAADTMIVLERTKRKDASTIMHITGRDIEASDIEILFNKDTHRWERLIPEKELDPVVEQYKRSGLSDTLRWLLEKDGEWEGTAKALFDNVRAWTGRDPAKNTKQLAGDLKLYTPLMKELDGITYYYLKRGTNTGVHHFIHS